MNYFFHVILLFKYIYLSRSCYKHIILLNCWDIGTNKHIWAHFYNINKILKNGSRKTVLILKNHLIIKNKKIIKTFIQKYFPSCSCKEIKKTKKNLKWIKIWQQRSFQVLRYSNIIIKVKNLFILYIITWKGRRII